MKYVKSFFMAVTFLAVGSFVWWAGMNYTGYCHAEGRYLSDEEKINSAIEFALYGYPPSIRKEIDANVNGSIQRREHWYVPENPIKYKDINEFIKINPECCILDMSAGESGSAGLLEKITGYVNTYVLIRYKVRYLDEDNVEKKSNAGIAVAVKNCGKAWSGL